MTLSPAMARDVERLIELRELEVRLRERARQAEVGGERMRAHDLFTLASGVREQRMALLERCHLL